MKRIAVAATLLLFVHAAAVDAQPQPPPAPDRIVDRWLRCEECSNGELQALVRFGQPAVGSLANALRNGPPQEARTSRQRQLSARYRSLVEYAKTHPDSPMPMTEDQYVRRHMDNFVVLYQIRAATGLGYVGGADARRELTQALAAPLPEAVVAAVRAALQRLA